MPFDIIIGRDQEEMKLFGNKGVVLLGKAYVKMGRTTSLSNNIYLDVARGHVVYITGKRGSGKCLLGDTLITLEDGRQIPIKDLEHTEGNILALNENLKIIPVEREGFYKRKVNRMLEIKFRSGKKISLTPEHPLLTINGWKEAERIPLYDRIATPRKIDAFGNSYLSEHEIKLLAYFIAEGHINKFTLFSNKDPIIIKDFKNSIEMFDTNLRIETHSKVGCFRICQKKKKILTYSLRNNLGQFINGPKWIEPSIKSFLKKHKIHGKLSPQKFIPETIFSLPRTKLALFLNRLFSCDGTIHKSIGTGWCISYATSSEIMAKQVHHLLLKFDILSKIRYKQKYRSYEIELARDAIPKFITEVGFFGEKEKRAEIALKEVITIKRNPNVDTIPQEIWEIYHPKKGWAEIGRQIGYAHPKALRESIRYSPSRGKLLQIAQIDENPTIEAIASSDIFWDQIIAIEEKTGEFEVYDITVPELHNFVANDIIVHNSYTMGAIAEGVMDLPDDIRNNLAMIMFDTMGVYWTMKYPNQKDEDLLEQWGMKGRGLDVKIYTPHGFFKKYRDEGIPTDYPFSIKASDLNSQDWILSFELKPSDPVAVIIEKTLGDFIEMEKEDYNIDDIISYIEKDDSFNQEIKNEAINRFRAAKRWGLFTDEGMNIMEVVRPGEISVIDLSPYVATEGGWGVKNLVIGLIGMRVFTQRMLARKAEELDAIKVGYSYFQVEEETGKREPLPIVWLVIDEAHEALPLGSKTAATDALVIIMREGRQPGVSLIMATQQPGKVHTDVMSQADIVLAHRLTAKPDVDALATMSQSYMTQSLPRMLDELPRVKGCALILDDSSERFYAMQVRPRLTWHGGAAPTAIKYRRKLELGL